jgi:hypothetical protein
MTLRRRLPQCRGAIAVELEHAGHHFRMQIGCFPDGALGEVFLDVAKQNSARILQFPPFVVRLAEEDEAWLVHGWLYGSRVEASANACWLASRRARQPPIRASRSRGVRWTTGHFEIWGGSA